MLILIRYSITFAGILTSQHWLRLGQFRDHRIRKTLEALPSIMAASRQANTIKTYVAAYKRFEVWAADFEEIDVFPTSDMAATVYILSLIQQGKSIASIQQYLFATAWLHSVAGYENPTKTPMVATVLEGAKRVTAAPVT